MTRARLFDYLLQGWREVPKRALVLGFAIAFVITGLAVTIAWNLRVDAWQSSLRTGRDVVRSISHDVERTLQTYDLSLRSIANDLQMPSVMGLPVDVRDRVLFDSSTRARYFGPIRVVDRDGVVVIDSTEKNARRINVADSTYFAFHAAVAEPGLAIGHPFKDDAGHYRVTLSRRVNLDDGSFGGVVVGTIELAYFEELFSKLELGDKAVMSLALDDGTLLMRVPHGPSDIGLALRGNALFDRIVKMREGSLEGRASIDGVRRLYVFSQVGSFPLSIAVGQSTDFIFRAWIWQTAWIGLFTAALLAGCATLAFILQRELIHRSKAEAELSALNAKLAELAREDGLTRLPNRRAFDQAIAEAWLRFNRYGEPLALLIVDIDHFKAYNDRFGHPQGDVCIRTVADEVRDCVTRPGDLAARYGGEEFVVLLPSTDAAGALAVADKLRRGLRARALPHDSGVTGLVTVSIGLSVLTLDTPATTVPQLIEQADRALYAAKQTGRNRVCLSAEATARLPAPSFGAALTMAL